VKELSELRPRCSAMAPTYTTKGSMHQCSNYALPGGAFCAAHDPAVKQKRKLALTTPQYWAKKAMRHKREMLRMVARGEDYTLKDERERYWEALERCAKLVLDRDTPGTDTPGTSDGDG
jgi:hypothetical protein